MRAAVLAVGTELFLPGRRDTNAEWLTERLERLGATVRLRGIAADDEAAIASLLRAISSESDAVVVTGGLGPTEDDRTREALARALGSPLETDPAMIAALEARYLERGRPFPPDAARQCAKPRGSAWIPNTVGAAPGVLAEGPGSLVAALPGVPGEMKAMFLATVEPRLRERARGAVARRTLKVAGRTESSVDGQLSDLYAAEGLDVTILASPGGIELHLRGHGATREAAEAVVATAGAAMEARLGADLFGHDDDTLPAVVGAALAERGLTVATAESCTGGLLGAAFTETPGSSAWYRGGFVVYANELKTSLAGVPAYRIEAQGAVSRAVAEALAHGAMTRCGADLGVGVTGIAGPGGGAPGKPVGLVHVAVADSGGTRAVELNMTGERRLVRARAVTAALDLVRRRLTETA